MKLHKIKTRTYILSAENKKEAKVLTELLCDIDGTKDNKIELIGVDVGYVNKRKMEYMAEHLEFKTE